MKARLPKEYQNSNANMKTPQALSYHLSKLKKADLIYETKFKNFIYYELNLSVLDETVMWINELRGGQK